MDYWEHHNQLNLHTKSKLSNDVKDKLCFSYNLKNLSYDIKSLTHTFIINKKLRVNVQFQPNDNQFHVVFYWGRIFRKKIYAFNLKLIKNDVEFLKSITVVQDGKTTLDKLTSYLNREINDCPFIYAQKKELKYLECEGLKDFYGFKRASVYCTINNDREIQVFKCCTTEDKKFDTSIDYHLYSNQLRRMFKNNGLPFVDEKMKIKQKLVKTPYYVSKRITHDDWFLIADFSNEGTGFLANNNGHYIYIFKSNQYAEVIKGTDKEFSLNELLSKYSLDYFKQNKKFNTESIDTLFSEFGLDANNLTEEDFEAYSMYDY